MYKNALIKTTLLFAMGVLLSCSPRVVNKAFRSMPEQSEETEILVFGEHGIIPQGTEILGMVTVGNAQFSTAPISRTFEGALELAKEEARKVGGNALRITKHLRPGSIRETHHIRAEILLVPDQEIQSIRNHREMASIDQARLRLITDLNNVFIPFDVYYDDSLVCRLSKKQGTFEINNVSPGNHILGNSKKREKNLVVLLQEGETRYVRCFQDKTSDFRVQYELIDWNIGRGEYDYLLGSVKHTDTNPPVGMKPASRLCFSIGSGYGYGFLTPIFPGNEAAETYNQNLKGGIQLYGDVIWYYNNLSGVGFCYTCKESSYHGNNPNIKENTHLSYMGPLYSLRINNYMKTQAFRFDLGAGLLTYRDNVTNTITNKYRAFSLGFLVRAGYDISLSKTVSIGTSVSFVSGELSSVKMNRGSGWDEVNPNKSYSVGELVLSLGLRFSIY